MEKVGDKNRGEWSVGWGRDSGETNRCPGPITDDDMHISCTCKALRVSASLNCVPWVPGTRWGAGKG